MESDPARHPYAPPSTPVERKPDFGSRVDRVVAPFLVVGGLWGLFVWFRLAAVLPGQWLMGVRTSQGWIAAVNTAIALFLGSSMSQPSLAAWCSGGNGQVGSGSR